MLEQSQDYKEEQFDYIQQTLRCVCMKCKYCLFFYYYYLTDGIEVKKKNEDINKLIPYMYIL